jgi:hypothetical protein
MSIPPPALRKTIGWCLVQRGLATRRKEVNNMRIEKVPTVVPMLSTFKPR